VVLAQYLTLAGQGVLSELPSLLMLPELPQGDGEVTSRTQGVRVATAQYLMAATQGVLTESASRLVVPQLLQYLSEMASRIEGLRMVLT
jgi:hypothetical protein